MLSGDLTRIAEVCTAIGNQATDDSGFVPIRDLLSGFHAELLIRPLLAEGMLASLGTAQSKDRGRWAVLIDSETHDVSMDDVAEERSTRQLPYRMRNTVAHELVHSLAFRSSEFGIQLKTKVSTKKGLQEFVEGVEKETERLSPLLLWSEKAIAKFLRGRKEPVSLQDLLAVMRDAGISRYVLVNRLLLIRPATDESRFLLSAGLTNLGIGIGVWGPTHAFVKGWPLFWNFEDGAVPSFLLKAHGHERLSAETLFADETCGMRGGPNTIFEIETDAGTPALPNAKRMRIRVAIEERLRAPGEEFLFVVHKSAH